MLGGRKRPAIERWEKLVREVPEWWGKDDNTPIPERVADRIVARAHSCCQICGNRVRFGGQIDHVVALINGGENREDNLQFLCKPCHTAKTGQDVALKAKSYRKRKKLGPIEKRRESDLARRWKWAKRIKAERDAE